jgi:hypothetical protein
MSWMSRCIEGARALEAWKRRGIGRARWIVVPLVALLLEAEFASRGLATAWAGLGPNMRPNPAQSAAVYLVPGVFDAATPAGRAAAHARTRLSAIDCTLFAAMATKSVQWAANTDDVARARPGPAGGATASAYFTVIVICIPSWNVQMTL